MAAGASPGPFFGPPPAGGPSPPGLLLRGRVLADHGIPSTRRRRLASRKVKHRQIPRIARVRVGGGIERGSYGCWSRNTGGRAKSRDRRQAPEPQERMKVTE